MCKNFALTQKYITNTMHFTFDFFSEQLSDAFYTSLLIACSGFHKYVRYVSIAPVTNCKFILD